MTVMRRYPGLLVLFTVLFVPAMVMADHKLDHEIDHRAEVRAGENIYKGNCLACHGRDGKGNFRGVPDFTSRDSVLARDEGLLTRSDEVLLTHLLDGFMIEDMAADSISREANLDLTLNDLRNVLAYLHEHFHYQTQARAGEEIYNQTCVACHGEKGKGTVPGAPDLTKTQGVLAQSDTVLLEHILSGFQSSGSPLAMPAKGANQDLTIRDIQNVLDYLHQHFHYRTYRQN